MIEPPFDRLPFATDRKHWRCYSEQATAADALAMLAGEAAPNSTVWLELTAVAAFAYAAKIDHARALLELGGGVLRWLRAGAVLDEGSCYGEVRFRGAPAALLSISRLFGCVFLHLPRHEEEP
jgi:hypothetical protein